MKKPSILNREEFNTIEQIYINLNETYDDKDLELMARYYGIQMDLDPAIQKFMIALHNYNSNRYDADMRVDFSIGTRDIDDHCLHASKYSIKEKLGSGTSGVVYKVIDRQTNKAYIFKIMLKNENVMGELKKQVLFSNKGIGPKVIDFWQCAGDISIIVMEIWNDGNLLTYMRKGDKLSLENINVLLNQVKEIHAMGYVHSDIKPENILVKKENNAIRVTLSDFGLTIPPEDYNKYPKWFDTIRNYILSMTRKENKPFVSRYEPYIKQYPQLLDLIAIYNVIVPILLPRNINAKRIQDNIEQQFEEIKKKIQVSKKHSLQPIQKEDVNKLLTMKSLSCEQAIQMLKAL